MFRLYVPSTVVLLLCCAVQAQTTVEGVGFDSWQALGPNSPPAPPIDSTGNLILHDDMVLTWGDASFRSNILGIVEFGRGQPAPDGLQDIAYALSSFGAASTAAFPPSREMFDALFGNPDYLGLSSGPFGVNGPASIAMAFGATGGANAVYNGRTMGAWFTASTGVVLDGATYDAYDTYTISPLVLDLSGDGLGASRGEWRPHDNFMAGPFAAFDIDGDGFQDIVEWVGPHDGLLTSSPHPRSGLDLLGSGEAVFAVTPCDPNPCTELRLLPGQGKVTDGALAHYDQNGLTIVPLP